jgi:hypothetical protein
MNEFNKKDHRFYLVGYCGMDRFSGISAIEEVINHYGYIIDFKMFSDISISFYIEMKENKIDEMIEQLKKVIIMDEPKQLHAYSEAEEIILLNVSFTKGSGNMKIEVPVVPG